MTSQLASQATEAGARRPVEEGATRDPSAGRSPGLRRRESWRIRGELAILLGAAPVGFSPVQPCG